jgi:hypothetical protein
MLTAVLHADEHSQLGDDDEPQGLALKIAESLGEYLREVQRSGVAVQAVEQKKMCLIW